MFLSSFSRYAVYIGIALVAVLGALLFYSNSSFQVLKSGDIQGSSLVINEIPGEEVGLFSGQTCDNAQGRPIAVMLAGDPQARPLSGISFADMVVEMPVVQGGITRYIAFFQCQEPKEIGSVRSARLPFLGIVKGYGAILAHWGGERDALVLLNDGIVENIDAIPNPTNAFWRRPGVPTPHDGFTSLDRLLKAAEKLNYELRITNKEFFTFKPLNFLNSNSNQVITIGYPGIFRASYQYSPKTKTYLRFKGGTPQNDALTGEQIQAKNVVTLWASIEPSYADYVDVALDNKQGRLKAFIEGTEIEGIWRKEGFTGPLLFFDGQGEPLSLRPGVIWVQILGLDQKVEIGK